MSLLEFVLEDEQRRGPFGPARRRWANSAYATVESVGHGEMILFQSDPFFVRSYCEGSGRLLLNAIVLGPGLGTATPLPW
jgi:hypothetical protein